MNRSGATQDLAAKPLPFMLLWGWPILIMLALNFFRLPLVWLTLIIVACFAWMGVGCAINARRCRRRHCRYASPVLLLGALATALVGFGIVDLGAYGLTYVTVGTYLAVLLAFVPELLLGKYRT